MCDEAGPSKGRKTIRSSARKMVYNVFQHCLAEHEAKEQLFNSDNVYARTATFTGLSESSVRRIVKEGITNVGSFSTPGKIKSGRPQKDFDDFNMCALRQAVQMFYTVRKEVPTLRKLRQHVRTELDINCSIEYLRKILHSIGFQFKKCKTERSALMESYYIASKREKYLQILRKNRDLPPELQKQVIYLDESYIHQSYKVKKCWQSINIDGVKQNVSKGKRYIIVHAGSKSGFVPNCLLIFSGKNKQEDYHSEMNAHNFTKWVVEKLIPNLHEPSIIVMDNAPYHNIVTNKTPNSNAKIDDIRLWLLENNIEFDPNLRKPSLIMIVKKHKPQPIYYIYEVLGEHGHIVVRLPPYHCDLNPIELIWAQAKHKIAAMNVGNLDIKKCAEEAFQSITAESWNNCCEHVIKLENEYYDRESSLYRDIEELIIQVDDSDSSFTSSDDDISPPTHCPTGEDNFFTEVEYLEFSDE